MVTFSNFACFVVVRSLITPAAASTSKCLDSLHAAKSKHFPTNIYVILKFAVQIVGGHPYTCDVMLWKVETKALINAGDVFAPEGYFLNKSLLKTHTKKLFVYVNTLTQNAISSQLNTEQISCNDVC